MYILLDKTSLTDTNENVCGYTFGKTSHSIDGTLTWKRKKKLVGLTTTTYKKASEMGLQFLIFISKIK